MFLSAGIEASISRNVTCYLLHRVMSSIFASTVLSVLMQMFYRIIVSPSLVVTVFFRLSSYHLSASTYMIFTATVVKLVAYAVVFLKIVLFARMGQPDVVCSMAPSN